MMNTAISLFNFAAYYATGNKFNLLLAGIFAVVSIACTIVEIAHNCKTSRK